VIVVTSLDNLGSITITLSYTFFEVGGKTPAAPVAAVVNKQPGAGS
jgi:cytochrome c oxidase assembly protein Cox11